jgi:hypothetical protein
MVTSKSGNMAFSAVIFGSSSGLGGSEGASCDGRPICVVGGAGVDGASCEGRPDCVVGGAGTADSAVDDPVRALGNMLVTVDVAVEKAAETLSIADTTSRGTDEAGGGDADFAGAGLLEVAGAGASEAWPLGWAAPLGTISELAPVADGWSIAEDIATRW